MKKTKNDNFTKGVNPSLSWPNALISASKKLFGFSERHKSNVLTRREYPKQAAKCNSDIPLTFSRFVHEKMLEFSNAERHGFDANVWQ